RELNQRVGLEYLFEKKVPFRDKRYVEQLASRQQGPGPVVVGQHVVMVEACAEHTPFGRRVFEDMRPDFFWLEGQGNDIDHGVVQVEFQAAGSSVRGGVLHFDQNFVADWVEQAPPHLETRDADVGGPTAHGYQFDVLCIRQLRRVSKGAVADNNDVSLFS